MTSRIDSLPALKEAVRWFLRLREGDLQESERSSWLEWKARSEANRRAYESVEAFWDDSDLVTNLPWPDATEMKADTYDGETPIPLPGTPMAVPRRAAGRRLGVGALAAAAAVLLVAGASLTPQLQMFFAPTEGVYQTATVERSGAILADGSEVVLGAKSLMTVDLDGAERRIVLEEGEAFFKVAKDPQRPFVVATGNGFVRAVGTAFNIHKGVMGVEVTVIEGRVEVSLANPDGGGIENPLPQTGMKADLTAGLQVTYDSLGEIGDVSEVDVRVATSWQDGRLVFVGKPLVAVIADVNRYSHNEITVADSRLEGLLFTGTVFQGQVWSWAKGLEKVFPLRSVRADDQSIRLVVKESS